MSTVRMIYSQEGFQSSHNIGGEMNHAIWRFTTHSVQVGIDLTSIYIYMWQILIMLDVVTRMDKIKV